ncbi:DUF6090 family protein [Flavobacterium sp.]|uniref:DUF6090 family protein n=1 Tax=Flavobacterium sp. TaxID=239 RepID=UPI0025C3A853|nr:DUF6090 family protein [Flavobacterium sp.]MBA4155395.1 hypothetical protein [Flavobacterium sp.]
MQDEVTKHTKKIYKVVKDPKHTFLEKVKEIIIEIFIIVFAVTLSIWLHNWSEQKHHQEETIDFLLDLEDDLNKDIKWMEKEKTRLTKTVEQYSILKNLTEKQIDSIEAVKAHIDMQINYVIRKTNTGNYEGFKSSGKIGFIENKKLKNLILEYYQESMPSLEEAEKFYNSRLNKIEELAYHNREKKKLLLDPIFKISLDLVIQSATNDDKGYDENIAQAKEIITEIDKETKE